MKRLLLLRHAKTGQADKDTPADSERQLTSRGRKDASLIGRALQQKGYGADLILCSPSRRTRQTLELANAEWRNAAKTEFVEAIYAAGAPRLLKLFQSLSDRAAAVLVVGHNPGFEDCGALLLPRGHSFAAANEMESADEKFPTGAVVVFDFAMRQWKDLAPHSGKLVDFIRPKSLHGV